MKNNRQFVIGFSLVIVGLTGILYYFLVMPAKENLMRVESGINQSRHTITALEEERQLLEEEQKNPINWTELRKELPETRDFQSIMTTVEAFEYQTKSKVIQLTFLGYGDSAKYSHLVQEKSEDVNEETEAEENITEESSKENQEDFEEQTVRREIDLEALPEQLALVTFSLEMQFESVKEMHRYIDLIENSERAIKIESYSFSDRTERDTVLDSSFPVEVTFEMTSFYYES